MTDLGNKMGARLLEKIADHEARTRCGRIDLAFVDYEMLDPHTAMLMLEYQPGLGAPKRSQVEDWVQSTFSGRFRPAATTLRHHVREGVVTLVVSEVADVLPQDRVAGMVRMGAAHYMDDQYRTWEITKNEKGERHLKRLQQDNIEEILQERLQRRRAGRYAAVDLGTLRSAGVANPDVGDSVIFFDPAMAIQQAGEITAMSADTVTVKHRDGSTKIPVGMIVDITERSGKAVAKEDAELKKFWNDAYGPDFPAAGMSIKRK